MSSVATVCFSLPTWHPQADCSLSNQTLLTAEQWYWRPCWPHFSLLRHTNAFSSTSKSNAAHELPGTRNWLGPHLSEIEAGRSDVTAVVRITSWSWEEAKSMIQGAGWDRSTKNLTITAFPWKRGEKHHARLQSRRCCMEISVQSSPHIYSIIYSTTKYYKQTNLHNLLFPTFRKKNINFTYQTQFCFKLSKGSPNTGINSIKSILLYQKEKRKHYILHYHLQ